LSAPIALALDAPDLATAIAWAQIVDGQVSTLKIGLETYLRDGLDGVEAIQAAAPNCELFLDLKLHDIPNTVAGACRSVSALNPKFLTVHALGGAEMVAKAAQTLPQTQITAVTVLTSMDQAQLTELKLGDAQELAMDLARVAVAAGAKALVCSPHEVKALRALVGPEISLITPGVRLGRDALGDQKRVSTPRQALSDGADLLVIGRPITGAWKTDGAKGVAAALGNLLLDLRSYTD
jgi:orotidine-5'-phosphate decarboxylase